MEHDIEHGPKSTAAGDWPDGAADTAATDPTDQTEQLVATGEPRVDAVLADLDALGTLPVSEHPPIFERVHGRLVEVLGELRADPDPAAQGHQAAD